MNFLLKFVELSKYLFLTSNRFYLTKSPRLNLKKMFIVEFAIKINKKISLELHVAYTHLN